uniref:Uncharacterized protein n=2 Tax=Ditylenchus dipsaci TaxID=166011 RepID=A0A915CKR4_9BILA
MLNLATKDICEKTVIAGLLDNCMKIVKYFRKSVPQCVLSNIQLVMNGSSTLLQLPIKTRWGTYAKLVSSISANEACLKSAVWDASLPVDDVLRNLRVLLCSDEFFWPTLNRTKEILRPLADSITRIEGNEMDSRGAYKMIKKAYVDAKQAVVEGDLGGPLQQEILEVLFDLSNNF